MNRSPNIRYAILLLSICCIVLSSYIAYSVWHQFNTRVFNEFHEDSLALNYRLTAELNDIVQIAVNNVTLAANSPLLTQSRAEPSSTAATEALKKSWKNMLMSSPSLYQIRLLDLQGDEIYRLERDEAGARWVTGSQLQNKRTRNYFIKGLNTDALVYLSELDLNKEQGIIERPFRPTIRATAKYFEQEQVAGLVVLNFDLRSEFAFFALQQSAQPHWIVKENDYFLSTPDNSEWGWLLERPEHRLSKRFAHLLDIDLSLVTEERRLSDTHILSVVTIDSIMPDVALEEDRYWIISELPQSAITALQTNTLYIIIVLSIVVLLIVICARYVDKLAKSIREKELLAIELAEKAQSSERTKSRFLAQMSHEIRTPMNGLFGLLQLTYGERDQRKINENLKNAIKSFETLRRVIDDILDFSKIEAGKLKLVEQPFALDLSLREVSQTMSRAAYGKNIDMWIDIDTNCPRECVGDIIRLNQILFNLSNNAIKFTNRGEIRLNVKLLAQSDTRYHLGFVLRDTGIGMSPAELEQVFSAFTQASDKTHIKFGGTGLGLTIVKQLIELMDGSITVSSEPGKGSTFVFDIWLGKAESELKFEQSDMRIDTYLLEILLISHSEVAKTIIQKQCATLGWISRSTHEVSSLAAFKFASNDNKKAVLIEDSIHLTKSDFDDITQFKARYPQVLFVLISKTTKPRLTLSEQKLFDVIISKPLTPSALYDEIAPFVSNAPANHIEESTSKSNGLANAHILVVEDNEINQMVAASMLENAGAKVSLASHGEECLNMLSDQPAQFDLILMDMQMPVMDGISATKAIRKNETYDSIPIVALTANAMEEEREACIEAGMQAHVAKPIDKAELIQTAILVISRT
uniref:hybrid sensor histidine kinase/response regulator n=1 Tax=Ningiella ruwaisensis TaxID=2364274 RepID=UPI00109F84EF|nr:ATP-binding protein [Ningiella ruwaisensis]